MDEDTVFHMRTTPEERRLIAAIKEETGVRYDADVLRAALRRYAKALKIKLKP